MKICWGYIWVLFFDLFVRLNEMHIDRHIDKCIDNETDMLPGVETETQSEVGTDFDKEIYSRDNSVNDLGDDVTAWYWILFESNKKHNKRFWAVFDVSEEGVRSAIRKVNSDAY